MSADSTELPVNERMFIVPKSPPSQVASPMPADSRRELKLKAPSAKWPESPVAPVNGTLAMDSAHQPERGL